MKHFGGRFKSSMVGLAIVLAVSLILPSAVRALTSITQDFQTDDALVLGSIVSLHDESQQKVDAATLANVDSIYGVVVNNGDSLLSLSSNGDNQVHIATQGIVPVLVTDINGPIERGDQITSSPISGVGMKATSNVKVVGVAQSALKEEHGSRETYTDGSGQQQTALLGEIPVHLNVSYYFKEPDKSIIPAAIQNLANSVAGKTVRPLPIIISAAIFMVTLIAVAAILFSMVRSSIISVGRNPLSQSAVYRNLIQISALVIGILSVAIVSIYLILTRF